MLEVQGKQGRRKFISTKSFVQDIYAQYHSAPPSEELGFWAHWV